MRVLKRETVQLRTLIDVPAARQKVRGWAIELRFSVVNQTKIVTAASELARNTLVYGQGGTMEIEALEVGNKQGLRITFEDQGPGITNVEQALTDGYSSGSGLGMGLGGSKRLVNEFEISSTVGVGTRIVLVKWC